MRILIRLQNNRKTILIVTSKEDLTADYLIIRLKEREIPFFRFNTEDLPVKYEGVARFPEENFIIINEVGQTVLSKDVAAVWYRRPKMINESGAGRVELLNNIREDSWLFSNGLLDLLDADVNWVSQPYRIRRAENKLYQLKVAARVGFRVPRTFIGNSSDELHQFLNEFEADELIVKPIRSGRYFLSEKVKVFYTSKFPKDWRPEEIKDCPVIIQERILKRRDIRVTGFRDKLFSVAVNTDNMPDEVKLDWRREINNVQYEPFELPGEITTKLLQILDVMQLSFGAFDIVESVNGEYVFLEVNPNGQWAWIEERTGLPFRDALIDSFYCGDEYGR